MRDYRCPCSLICKGCFIRIVLQAQWCVFLFASFASFTKLFLLLIPLACSFILISVPPYAFSLGAGVTAQQFAQCPLVPLSYVLVPFLIAQLGQSLILHRLGDLCLQETLHKLPCVASHADIPLHNDHCVCFHAWSLL